MALLHKPECSFWMNDQWNGSAGMHEMRDLLRRAKEQGVTIFLSSHFTPRGGNRSVIECSTEPWQDDLRQEQSTHYSVSNKSFNCEWIRPFKLPSCWKVCRVHGIPVQRHACHPEVSILTAVNEFLARQNVYAERSPYCAPAWKSCS